MEQEQEKNSIVVNEQTKDSKENSTPSFPNRYNRIKPFVKNAKRKIALKHYPINGYRHTVGFVNELHDGTYRLVLMCVKKCCKEEAYKGNFPSNEVWIPIEKAFAEELIKNLGSFDHNHSV